VIQVTVKASDNTPLTMKQLEEFIAQAQLHGITEKAVPQVTTTHTTSGQSSVPKGFYSIEVTDTVKATDLR
jgi:hypothetical protein